MEGRRDRAGPTDRDVAAARENAEWVDRFCGVHGVRGRFGERTWHSPRRTPPLCPDAITLRPTATEVDVVSDIDLTAGASIKDSFSALDLSGWGFRRLLEARWIWRAGDNTGSEVSPLPIAWRLVESPVELAAWERGWGEGTRVAGHFPPALLHDDRVRFLAGYRRNALVAGLVLHVTDTVVGVSNAFHPGIAGTDFWLSCLGPALGVAAGRPLVGYATRDEASVASQVGFEVLGPLTVWIVDGEGSG